MPRSSTPQQDRCKKRPPSGPLFTDERTGFLLAANAHRTHEAVTPTIVKNSALKVTITRICIRSAIVAIVGATHRSAYCEAADKAWTKTAAIVTTTVAMPMLGLSRSCHSEGRTRNT